MPNLTISVSEQLKSQMDSFSEVSWSEICRKAITAYIQSRINPMPQIQLRAGEIDPESYHESGYPGLRINLLIQNKMSFEVIVDRILYKVSFYTTRGQFDGAGSDFELYKHIVPANAMGGTQFFLKMMKEKIMHLDQYLEKTFQCKVECIVFVEGFKQPYKQEVRFKIPIDEWKKFVDRVKPEKTTKEDISVEM